MLPDFFCFNIKPLLQIRVLLINFKLLVMNSNKSFLNRSIVITALATIVVLGSGFIPTIRANWEFLGTKTVNYKLDRDVLRITAKEGAFTKLKLQVTGGSLNMHKMIVEYGNGKKEEINLKHNFNRRSDSRVIDLNGGKRIIRDITFIYDTKDRSRRRAKVHVYGRH